LHQTPKLKSDLKMVAQAIVILPTRSITKYEFTPRDSMGDTLNKSFEGELPKKRAQKIKDETPTKDTYAGNSSKDLGVRDSIEFVRPASSRREKTKSKVFDFTPPKFAPRRYPNGIRNQRYSKSPYATHDAAVSNGVDFKRPTTPFAQHEHVSNDQVYSPRRARTFVAIPTTPTPRPFVRPPPGGHCSGIFG